MPIPFIVAGLIGGVVGAVNIAARSVNNDAVDELNAVNRQIEQLAKETQGQYQAAANILNDKIEKQNDLKTTVQQETIKDYSDLFNNISNLTYEKFKAISSKHGGYNFLEIEKAAQNFRKEETSGVSIAKNIAEFSLLSPIGGGLFVVGKIIKYNKICNETSLAKAQLEKQKTNCEKVQIKIALLNDTSQKCDEIKAIIWKLNGMLVNLTSSINQIIRKYGNNYDDWDEDSQELLMTSVNVAYGLNRMILTPIVKENGDINEELVKVVKEVPKITGLQEDEGQRERLKPTEIFHKYNDLRFYIVSQTTEEIDGKYETVDNYSFGNAYKEVAERLICSCEKAYVSALDKYEFNYDIKAEIAKEVYLELSQKLTNIELVAFCKKYNNGLSFSITIGRVNIGKIPEHAFKEVAYSAVSSALKNVNKAHKGVLFDQSAEEKYEKFIGIFAVNNKLSAYITSSETDYKNGKLITVHNYSFGNEYKELAEKITDKCQEVFADTAIKYGISETTATNSAVTIHNSLTEVFSNLNELKEMTDDDIAELAKGTVNGSIPYYIKHKKKE